MTQHRYLRRAEVPAFLKESLGVTISPLTLAKMASLGKGPEVEYFGRIPVYRADKALAWGRSRIGRRPRHLGSPAAPE
jgi:hypothetical protein